MKNRVGKLLAGFLTVFCGAAPVASADPIQVKVRIVGEDGRPLSDLNVRVVIGSEKDSRSPASGAKLRTSADGRVSRTVDAPVKQRSIRLDSPFARHPSQLIEVGVEMEMLGRRALYWIELDLVKAGPLAGMTALVQSPGGLFERPLTFHDKTHSWSFPDQPGGMMLTGIGARLVEHNMVRAPGGAWTIDLLLEKQKFEVR